ncbi:MAG: hypothetical protein R2880_11370 [Deinococcales bacterium]
MSEEFRQKIKESLVILKDEAVLKTLLHQAVKTDDLENFITELKLQSDNSNA